MPLLGPEGRKQLKAMGFVGTAGIELVVSTVVGYFGGMWIGDQLGVDWLQWVGLALGLVAGFRSLYRVSRKVQQQLSSNESDENQHRND